MLHAEMVLVVPVLAVTFLVMGWIVLQFRGYLKQREAMMVEMEARHAPAAHPRRDAVRRDAA